MMTTPDKTLLELAAKAAGYLEIDGCSIEVEKGMRWVDADREWIRYWNPLTDDGDALRLAVKLGFAVSVEYQVGSTSVLWGPPICNIREPHGDDPQAATRRAIVKAAAMIGEST